MTIIFRDRGQLGEHLPWFSLIVHVNLNKKKGFNEIITPSIHFVIQVPRIGLKLVVEAGKYSYMCYAWYFDHKDTDTNMFVER